MRPAADRGGAVIAPPPLTWIAIIAATASFAVAGIQTVRLADEQSDHAKTKAEHAQQVATAAKATTDAVEVKREIERIQRSATTKEIDRAHNLASAARTDASHADAVGRRMLDQLATLAASTSKAGPDTDAAAGSSSTSGPGLVLTDLLGRLEPRGRELAAFLDQARISGLACERIYDAMSER